MADHSSLHSCLCDIDKLEVQDVFFTIDYFQLLYRATRCVCDLMSECMNRLKDIIMMMFNE